jgi:NADH dehydrogenase
MNIVIIGGGFAGINLAELLIKGVQVTLVDKNNYNFSAAYYQVATAFLEPSSISYPYRKLLVKKNLQFRWKVIESCAFRKKIILHNGERVTTTLFCNGC